MPWINMIQERREEREIREKRGERREKRELCIEGEMETGWCMRLFLFRQAISCVTPF